MGLTLSLNMGESVPLNTSPSSPRDRFVCWVHDHIKKKECRFFQKSTESDGEALCMCKYLRSSHAEGTEDLTGEKWNIQEHVAEVPTDAFGDICFGGLGRSTAKYMRVSSDTNPEVLYQLLTEQWKLSPPNLLISVTGGTKNFQFKSHLMDVCYRSLIQVAQTTDAWIITQGTNTGIIKFVGKTVRDFALSSHMNSQIVAIGVASWGSIYNRNVLVNPQGSGCFPAHYHRETAQGQLSRLDNNHTHFLLVDNGMQGQYGVELELRARLEKCISEKRLGNQESGVTIPVVCLVLDGGGATLTTMYNAVLNGTPCVVLEGSGRIADVVASVAELPVSRVTIALIQQLMKKFFGQEYEDFSDLKIIEWTKKIQDIIRMPHLLTVFRLGDGDVDVAILQALFKASRSSESQVNEGWKRQLDLAMAWNRADIAKMEIFTEERQWNSSDLHSAMGSALVGNKPEFVRLLLENGVSFRDFLEGNTLGELYNNLPNSMILQKLGRRVCYSQNSVHSPTISMTHVSDEIHHLLGRYTKALYRYHSADYYVDVSADSQSKRPSSGNTLKGKKTDAHWNPARDVFLWAILQNNKELSKIAWEKCEDCTVAALAASKILKKLAAEDSDADEGEKMIELANHYETLAMGVFSECYSCDKKRAQELLVRASPLWGKTTCVRLALEADDKNFVAQSGVQALLNQIWCGDLSVENRVWRVVVCSIFFPLIYTGFLAFRDDEVFQTKAEKKKIKRMDLGPTCSQNKNSEARKSQRKKELKSCWAKMVALYSAPQVIFYLNIMSYFAFLTLFAVVIMIDFQPTPSASEILLYIWIFSLLCEEMRELFYNPDEFGCWKKAKMYLKDFWNKFDVVAIIIFIIGLAFRLLEDLFYYGKIILCIDFMVFCFRLMAIFTLNRTLGPKIIMVKKMMMDLFFFMFLLSIWVVAYGVAKQGILIHNEDRLGWIFRGAVYEPYMIIFGDIPSNIDNTAFDINTCSMNGSDPLKPKCPVLNENQMPAFPEWLTIIMLCVYLLFANILLLNLLIAIFNYTFEEVHDNTDRIWKFQRYELIKEYHSRPSAPPPFIILSHLFLIIKGIVQWRDPKPSSEFKNELSQTEEKELLLWEAFMKNRYLMSTAQEQIQSIKMEREDPNFDAVMNRLSRLEEQAMQSTKALQWIMDRLKSPGLTAEDAPSLVMLPEDTVDFSTISLEKEEIHVKARQLDYPDKSKKVTRFPVPEEKVPWDVSFSSYKPPYYSSEDSRGLAAASESEADNYLNPRGRTGLRGLGVLPHLGANLNLDLVLTRWTDSRRSVLEFLGVKTGESWVLPGGEVDSADGFPVALEKTMEKELCQKIQAALSSATKVFEGYVDDCRNTDNAWVETTVLNLHLDRDSPLLTDINNMVTKDKSQSLQWQTVCEDTRISLIQRDVLIKVAELHKKTI